VNDERCSDLLCPDCHPEVWDPESEKTALVWPWGLLLVILLFVWAAWFVTSGAVRP